MFFLPREVIDRLHDIKGSQVEARSSKPASWQAVSPARFAAAPSRTQAIMAATGTALIAERLLDEARCPRIARLLLVRRVTRAISRGYAVALLFAAACDPSTGERRRYSHW